MTLILETALKEKIKKNYEDAMNGFPAKKQEVDAYIADCSETKADCIRFLYAFMHPNDMLSYHVSELAAYADASLEMYEKADYIKQIPQELFLTYVLSCRVNNEALDGSRGWLMQELLPRIEGKDMLSAALEVNYWCYEKATYIPSDSRTIAPKGMCSRAKGRCGEESTLAVCAMRSVGIPARQCYVPRWSHCDDNHAWVEIWVDGKWHYIGACEPEPVLDKGWFTSAASKAMLVHAKAYSCFLGDEKASCQYRLYALMNETQRYADCRTLTVCVTEHGRPLKGVHVSFQIINYSELFELYGVETDEDGNASFVTGRGDLYVSAVYDGKVTGKKVDLRQNEHIELKVEEGYDPYKTADITESIELVPPAETVGKLIDADNRAEHNKRLSQCERIRADFEKTFDRSEFYLEAACGNHAEIKKFLECKDADSKDKMMLLDTLREKDFADVSAEVLRAYLLPALKYRNQLNKEAYQLYLLAPRIDNEMLTMARKQIAEYLEKENIVFKDGEEVWKYVNSMTMLEEYGSSNFTADAWGCVKYHACTPGSRPVVFVQICRAAGIMARLNPVTHEPEYVLVKPDGSVKYISVAKKECKSGEIAECTLSLKSERTAAYERDFTIARYADGEYHTYFYEDFSFSGHTELTLEKGSYRIITTVRQIDGTVSAVSRVFVLDGDRSMKLEFAEDKTKSRLLYAELPDTNAEYADGSHRSASVKSLCAGRKTVLAAVEPGKEPTEHLLTEILEHKAEYIASEASLVLLLGDASGLENATLKSVIDCGIDVSCLICADEEYFMAMHVAFNVGDERLPFAAAVNADGKGLFAFANYNIGTARRLLDILLCE